MRISTLPVAALGLVSLKAFAQDNDFVSYKLQDCWPLLYKIIDTWTAFLVFSRSRPLLHHLRSSPSRQRNWTRRTRANGVPWSLDFRILDRCAEHN